MLLTGCSLEPPTAASVRFDATGPVEMKARFVNRLILVEVAIDGERVAPFLLDTGSDVTVIDKRTRGQFLMRPESAAVARGAGGTVSSAFVRAKSLDAGPIHADAPAFLVLDLSRFERVVGRPIGGILGLDLLRGLSLEIDYPAAKLRAAPSGVLKIADVKPLTLEARAGLLGVPVALDGTAACLLLDTGMTGALALDAEDGARRGIVADATREEEWRVGIGGGSTAAVGAVKRVTLGDRELLDFGVVLEKPAGQFEGALGAGILHFFRCVLDFGEGTLQLSSTPGAVAELGVNNRTGMRFDFRFEAPEQGWRVDAVRADSPAARAGIRAGDIVTAIRGTNVKDSDWRRTRDLLTWRSGELTVRILGDASSEPRILRP
jgi:predicted aspartyl protease